MIVALLATGGSTNHAIHLVAMARAAGRADRLDRHGPAVVRHPRCWRGSIPNGSADVDAFQAAGGVAFVARELAAGRPRRCRRHDHHGSGHPSLFPGAGDDRTANWSGRTASPKSWIVTYCVPPPTPSTPRAVCGCVKGNLGRAVIKISAVKPNTRTIEAKARVSDAQEDVPPPSRPASWTRAAPSCSFQGPKANGMPELHIPVAADERAAGSRRSIALVTDGRMSAASGETPAAIHW